MPKPFEPVPVKPGALITNTDPQQIGFENYTVKCDFRRVFQDRDARREGHTWFFPKTNGNRTNQSTLPGGLTVTLLAMARRADGKVIFVGGNKTTLYRFVALEDLRYFGDVAAYFDPNDAGAPYFKATYNDWETIGTGFSASGERWQAIEVNNSLVLNNAVDLLMTFDVTDETVTPIYELRDNGIASVGTIAEHNGILMCGDVRELKDTAATRNNGLVYAIADTSITLPPATINLGYRDIEQLVYSGDGHPYEGVDYSVDYDHGIIKILSDFWGTEFVPKSLTFRFEFSGATLGPAESLLRSSNLYSTVTNPTQYDRFENRVLWSMPGLPRRFAASVPSSIDAGSRFLNFNFPTRSFVAGQQILVIAAGLDGGNLNAKILQIVYSTNSFGYPQMQVFLDTAAAISVTDALVVSLDSVGSIVGFEDLDDQGGAVLRMGTLRDKFIVYKEFSIFIATYTGQATAPFDFGKPVYQGSESIFYKHTLARILDKAQGYDALYGGGQSHFYVGRDGFYRFNLISRAPVRIATEVENLFFDVARSADPNLIYCADNALTKEIFLCYPNTDPVALAIASLNRDGLRMTVETDTPHGFTVGQLVSLHIVIIGNPDLPSYYNGVYPVAAVLSPTEFVYNLPNGSAGQSGELDNGPDAAQSTVSVAAPSPRAICFDYKYGTVSTTGAAFTAAATIQVPTATIPTQAQHWFVMGTSGSLILQYGLSDTNQWTIPGGSIPTNALFDRLGSDYVCVTQSGYGHVGPDTSDTAINGYEVKIKSFPQFVGFGILVLQSDGSVGGFNYNYSTNLSVGTDQRRSLYLPAMHMGLGVGDSITVYKAGDRCEVLSRQWQAREVRSDGFGRTP